MIKHVKKHWSTIETAKLLRLWGEKTSINDIARRLKRTSAQVRCKVSNLRKEGGNYKRHLGYRTDITSRKLTAEAIPGIRKDSRRLKVIAAEHDVSAVTIHKIKKRLTWKSVS